ncbi:hypothetical protein PR048_020225 [Dryococelus australis]|uniref:Uncharacterized protein n=1 Tax=Dryococelus australis TaxID=614101 RepID=A0ABQ9H5P5_9NEOP|nr:hypothetical protein PR048_020225 [Dryococelus australis]
MCSAEDVLLLIAVVEDEDREKTRSVWVYEINATRDDDGDFYSLVPELLKDDKRFYVYFRMSVDCFDEILNMIRDDISKKATDFRRPIPPE